MKQKLNYVALAICISLPIVLGAVSGFVTSSNIPTWYAALTKPWFNPPNWIFAPVWTTLYILMGISSYLVYISPSTTDRSRSLVLYGIQLFLNFIWSIVFFGMHQIGLALIVIVAMWIAILLTMLAFGKIDRRAAWLMVPYITWVSFATILNFYLKMLNQ